MSLEKIEDSNWTIPMNADESLVVSKILSGTQVPVSLILSFVFFLPSDHLHHLFVIYSMASSYLKIRNVPPSSV